MKTITCFIILFLLVTAPVFSSDSLIMQEPANITAQATYNKDKDSLIIDGTTNLPNGTKLKATIHKKYLVYVTAEEGIIFDNAFSISTHNPQGSFETRNYMIRLSSLPANEQSEEIQQIIGKRGEYLTGPSIFETWSGNVVEYEFTYPIGSQDQVLLVEKQEKNKIDGMKKKISNLISEGISMEEYRNYKDTNDFDKARICGQKMRQFMAEARAIEDEAMKTPYYSLRLAAAESIFCVSCSSSALEACARASRALAEAEFD